MATQQTPLAERAAWTALQEHYEQIGDKHLREFFAEDATRGERYSAEAEGILLDYSKNRVNDETLKLLLQLAQESGVEAHRDAMFRGEKINVTENRAVLHVALRAPKEEQIFVDGRGSSGAHGAGQDGGLLGPRALGCVEGIYR